MYPIISSKENIMRKTVPYFNFIIFGSLAGNTYQALGALKIIRAAFSKASRNSVIDK